MNQPESSSTQVGKKQANDTQTDKPKLLDEVRTAIRLRRMSYRTEQTYIDWIKRYIFYHGKRHPKEMSAPEIRDFLAHLVNDGNVAASTQNVLNAGGLGVKSPLDRL